MRRWLFASSVSVALVVALSQPVAAATVKTAAAVEKGLLDVKADPKTGKIDHVVAKEFEKYDLRLYAERNWSTIGPKLTGKIHIWVGEADDYFLNNGVHYFDDFISKADPKYDGWIVYDARGRHGWMAKPMTQLMKEMLARVGK